MKKVVRFLTAPLFFRSGASKDQKLILFFNENHVVEKKESEVNQKTMMNDVAGNDQIKKSKFSDLWLES